VVGLALVALVARLALDVGLIPALDRQVLERPLALRSAPTSQRRGAARAPLVAHRVPHLRGARLDAHRLDPELDTALERARAGGRAVLAVTRGDFEGEVRAAAWRLGGEAREVARVSGLGEINGEVIEGVIFRVAPGRGGSAGSTTPPTRTLVRRGSPASRATRGRPRFAGRSRPTPGWRSPPRHAAPSPCA